VLGTEVIKLKKDVQLLKNKWQKSLWSSTCIDVSLVAILRNDPRVTFTEDQNLKPFTLFSANNRELCVFIQKNSINFKMFIQPHLRARDLKRNLL
jgi:predicted GH43/DUF377 family glycosyl hydrolase